MTVTLYQGDCLEYMKTMAAGSVDAIITDFPYGTTAFAWDTIIPFEPMWEQVKRILKPRGVFITTASQPFTSILVMSNLKWFKYELIWKKTIGSGFLDAKNKPLKLHENIVLFSASAATHEGRTTNRMTYNPIMQKGKPYKYIKNNKIKLRWSNMFHPSMKKTVIDESLGKRYPNSVLEFSNGNYANEHPTQKPIVLYEYLIHTYTNPGETVLDICAGSGTTGVAAVQLGRNFIGCEIDPGYFKIAEKRIHAATLQPSLFQHEERTSER